MKLIKQGQQSETVRSVQALLNVAAQPVPKLVEDGIFGPKTKEGVQKFQWTTGLSADGIVGPKTATALLEKLGFFRS